MSFENGFEILNSPCFESKCCFDADISSFQGQKQLSDAMSNPVILLGQRFSVLLFTLNSNCLLQIFQYEDPFNNFMKPHN